MTRVRTEERVVARAEAVARATSWIGGGLRVVLANGVFDLLHVGHCRYLIGARHLGDRLVVAVNGDRSVAARKGPGRPVVRATDRARLVAALRGVDLVVVFEEPTVDRLLEEMTPAVHAKGTDYRVDDVPERETMRRLGGTTAITGDPKSHSNRDLVERIRRQRGEGS